MFFGEQKLTKAEEALHARALRAAKSFVAAQSELLAVVREADGLKLYERFGLSSTFRYCVERLGISEDVACNLIAVGRLAKTVPELAVAVTEGLSISKARKIVPVLNPGNKTKWLEHARSLSYRALEAEIAKERPELAVTEKVKTVAEDRVRIELGLSNSLLAQFRQAQNIVSGSLRKSASLEETLAALLEKFLSKEKSSLGIPAATLRALNARDKRSCRAEQPDGSFCGNTRFLHVHHIQPRELGGTHELSNLITLCSDHHRQAHSIRRTTDVIASLQKPPPSH